MRRVLNFSSAPLFTAVAQAGGRYIVDSGSIILTETAKELAAKFPLYPVPTFEAPWLLMKVYSWFDGEVAAVMGRWRAPVGSSLEHPQPPILLAPVGSFTHWPTPPATIRCVQWKLHTSS